MTDLVLIAAMLGFIALCIAYVGWCNRIVGADDVDTVAVRAQPTSDPAPIAATIVNGAAS